MTQEIQKNSYLLLDSRNAPLARGELLTNPDAPTLQVRVLDHKISDVMNHEEIQLVPMGVNGAALLGRIVRSRNDNIVLEKSGQRYAAESAHTHRFSELYLPHHGPMAGPAEHRGQGFELRRSGFLLRRPP